LWDGIPNFPTHLSSLRQEALLLSGIHERYEMTRRLENKIAIVFGAGSVGPGWGNGKATAALFAREGAKVVGVDVNLAAAEETRDIIRGEGGVFEAMRADVTRSAEIKAAVDATLDKFGRIDILHNNVGITIMGDPTELSEEDWHRSLSINTTSIFLTCKHVLPIMKRQGSGAIVNMSSLAAIRYTGYPYSAYYAAKGAVNQLTVGLALQYAPTGIRVNAIMPGYMNTPLIHQQISGQYATTEEMVAARDALSPTGKMGTGWDIAYAALFLASDEAKYITGVCLPVDGGIHCKVG
jgi:NAD(P)-dependent dehydrogenase (short-subunit alcohol dehydrogenase family)